MSAESTEDRYPLALRLLHWLMALLILGLIGVGLWMTGLPDDDPNRIDIYLLHKATGVLVLLLAFLRLGVRIASQTPAPAASLLPLERKVSVATQHSLYLLMFLVPLAGILLSQSAGYAVSFFGLFDVPTLVGKSKDLHEFFEEAHEIGAWLILVIVLVHAGAALKHHFIDHRASLRPML